jgi:phage shock protein A
MQTTRILRISQIALGCMFIFFITSLWYAQQPGKLENISNKIKILPVNQHQIKIQIEQELNKLSQSWWNDPIEDVQNQMEKIQISFEELMAVQENPISIENETHFLQLRSLFSKQQKNIQFNQLQSDLNSKVKEYLAFVREKRYPRLIKIAQFLETMSTKIDIKNDLQIQKICDESLKLMEEMSAIVRKSSLNNDQRGIIQSKIDSIGTEYEMLKQIAQNISNIQRELVKYQQATMQQMKKIVLSNNQPQDAPKDFTESKQTLLIMSVLLFLFTAIMMYLTVYMQRRSLQINQNYVESAVLELMEKVSAQRDLSINTNYLSERFTKQFRVLNDYINLRMSYGSLFQNSLPVPTICLNNQLKVNWCNPGFISDFGIEEFKHQLDNLSWDYLRKFTNISDYDPILESMQNDRENSLSVRVKKPNSSKSRPYLMHVRPVTYQHDKYIMLYFIPMDFVENSIEKHSKAVIQPMLESLKMLNEDRESSDEWDKIKEMFQVINAGNIFQKIEDYRTHITQKISEMQTELQNLKNTNSQLKQQQNLYRLRFTQVENYLEKGSNAFRKVKSDFVSFGEIINQQSDQLNLLTNKYTEVSKYAQEKDNYLVQWNSNLAKIEHSLNTLLDSHSLKKSLEEIIYQLKHASKHTQPIDTIIQNIELMHNSFSRQEVYLTKMKMMLNEVDRKNMPMISSLDFDVLTKSYNEQIEQFEDSLVVNLQDAYVNLQATKQELKAQEQSSAIIN